MSHVCRVDSVSYYNSLCKSPVLTEPGLNGHSGHCLFQLTLPIHIQHNVETEQQQARVQR